jgi:hypothetical protein
MHNARLPPLLENIWVRPFLADLPTSCGVGGLSSLGDLSPAPRRWPSLLLAVKVLNCDIGCWERHRLSRQTLMLHHKKHHAKHVAIINGMVQGTELEKDSLEEIMLKAHRSSNLGLFNNAASTWNHNFFWKCLR